MAFHRTTVWLRPSEKCWCRGDETPCHGGGKRLEYHPGNAESGILWRSNPHLPLEKMLVCDLSPSCSGLLTEEDVAVIYKVSGTEPPLFKEKGDGNGEKSFIPHPAPGDRREGGMLRQEGMS